MAIKTRFTEIFQENFHLISKNADISRITTFFPCVFPAKDYQIYNYAISRRISPVPINEIAFRPCKNHEKSL